MGFNKIKDWGEISINPGAKKEDTVKQPSQMSVNAEAFLPISPQPTPTVSPASDCDEHDNIDAMANLRTEYAELKQGLLEDLSLLRKDVELLKSGGWRISIGPWQQIGGADSPRLTGEPSRVFAVAKRGARNSRAVSGYGHHEHDEDCSCLSRADRSSSPEPSAMLGTAMGPGSNEHVNKASIQNGAHPPKAKEQRPEEPLPTIEDSSRFAGNGLWAPAAIRHLPELNDRSAIPPEASMVTFSKAFLMSVLGGEEWSPCFYFNALSRPAVLPSYSYYLMDAAVEPFLPKRPGDHGAKLTALFNNSELDIPDTVDPYKRVPIFICDSARDGPDARFAYYGSYSQKRWSDRLDYDTMTDHVPQAVKMYHAELLTGSNRPQWLTDALLTHFWPKPTYEGALPNITATGSTTANADELHEKVVKSDVKAYITELRDWRKDAEMKVKMIKKEQILKAFEEADAADLPGLRLQWEYFHCDGFDPTFYQTLINHQERLADPNQIR